MILDPDQVLLAEGVWKKYARTVRASRNLKARSLRHAVFGRQPEAKLEQHEFWALRDVSLSIRRGEALGLIGLNGAGKSTLLTLIGGFMLPDRGRIATRGAVGSLLDLMSGFQPSLSGLENIFVKGAIQGRSREEMQRQFDQIVDFAELGDAIQAPLGGYSAGMKMRLAFSVAIHAQPSLLLVDEVLSVGDFRFRQKCLERIGLLRERTAFLMASHSMNDVARFCDRVIVLDTGKVAFEGPAKEAIAFYQGNEQPKPSGSRAFTGETFHNRGAVGDIAHDWVDSVGQTVGSIPTGATPRLLIRFRLLRPVRRLIVGVPIWSKSGHLITGISSDVEGVELVAAPGDTISIDLSLDGMRLNPGAYAAVVAIVDGSEFLYRHVLPTLGVSGDGRLTWGDVTPRARWIVQQASFAGTAVAPPADLRSA